jgi:hypothetical protein
MAQGAEGKAQQAWIVRLFMRGIERTAHGIERKALGTRLKVYGVRLKVKKLDFRIITPW